MKTRKHLSASGLFRLVRQGFARVKDVRADNTKISLRDALMSGFALFSLKDPSLLALEERQRTDANLKRIFGLEQVPSDTQMRTILDEVDPENLRPLFGDVFRQLQRGKVLKQLEFLGGYLLSLDGTGYFTSKQVHCASCLEKRNRRTDVGRVPRITYSHQTLSSAAIVHPERREVIALMPEPIIKQDGETKNDCERNAAKRFLAKLRQDHPHLPFIVIEDALSSNGPHIRELQRHDLRFILGVKVGSRISSNQPSQDFE